MLVCLRQVLQAHRSVRGYVTAILLHPNKRKNYLIAAWKQRWVQEGIQRAEALWYRRLDHHNAEVTAVNDELRPEALELTLSLVGSRRFTESNKVKTQVF